MKTINLFVKFQFTSKSPDTKPISLGIVSDEIKGKQAVDQFNGVCHKDESKSFYSEFTDFDLNRCDDWVKENVVNKLILGKKEFPKEKVVVKHIDFIDRGDYLLYQKEWEKGDHETLVQYDNSPMILGNTAGIKNCLKQWLSQFSDYDITFVCDCGTFDWYWMLQLLAEWDSDGLCHYTFDTNPTKEKCHVKCGKSVECPLYALYPKTYPINLLPDSCNNFGLRKIGLPKLPANISPVPQDLNDLIASKKGVSVREAFDIDREELAYGFVRKFFTDVEEDLHLKDAKDYGFKPNPQLLKHNALWDAKVIKAIYEKLK